jgi:putative GTP pyrophosphokinase
VNAERARPARRVSAFFDLRLSLVRQKNAPLSSALADYDAIHDTLVQQARDVEDRLRAWLAGTGMKLHSVSSRVKSRSALEAKLARPDRTYGSLWDVTDLIGLRVITYFEDTIDDVAALIEKHLAVDFAHSVDKRRAHDPAGFGYRSLHYVCAFDTERASVLPESARCEVQVRSLLQHAWAEIEHDLGYKSQAAIPVALRRRFSRIASLLEVADEEFMSVRRALETYAEDVESRLAKSPDDLLLDQHSLASLVDRDVVRALDVRIARALGRPQGEDVFFPDYLLRMLSLAGLETAGDVLSGLDAYAERIVAMAQPYFSFASHEWRLSPAQMPRLYRGYSLFFLAHVALLHSPLLGISKAERLSRFYGELDYPDDPRTAQRVASGLLEALAHDDSHA